MNNKVDRYALFAGAYHYPIGGISDYVISSDEIEPLKRAGLKNRVPRETWAHIVDLRTMKQIMTTNVSSNTWIDLTENQVISDE